MKKIKILTISFCLLLTAICVFKLNCGLLCLNLKKSQQNNLIYEFSFRQEKKSKTFEEIIKILDKTGVLQPQEIKKQLIDLLNDHKNSGIYFLKEAAESAIEGAVYVKIYDVIVENKTKKPELNLIVQDLNLIGQDYNQIAGIRIYIQNNVCDLVKNKLKEIINKVIDSVCLNLLCKWFVYLYSFDWDLANQDTTKYSYLNDLLKIIKDKSDTSAEEEIKKKLMIFLKKIMIYLILFEVEKFEKILIQ